MRKKFIKIGFLFFLLFVFPVHASCQTLGELKQEYQNKLNEKAANDSKTQEAKDEIARNEAAVRQAEAQIHAAEKEQHEVEEKIEESNKKIDESNLKIEKSNQKIEELSKEVQGLLLYLQQMQGQNAYVEYVSGASSVTEMIMRIATIEQITDHIQNAMDELEEEVRKLEEEVQKLEEEVKRNEKLKEELIEKQKQLEVEAAKYKQVIQARYQDISNYDKYALDINTQVKSLKTKLDAAEKNCATYAPSKGDAAVINVDCVKKVYNSDGTVVTVDNSEWLKPLNSGIITSEVAYRWGSYHNALDIGGNAEGTPVYAAAAGVVSGKIERYSCGGNMLYIDVVVNGQPYTTYYYHLLRFNVNVGDVVTQDTIIGYVGGGSTASALGGYDNCTFGAHLHFGVANGFYNGYSVPSSKVIVPPGFPNKYLWRFTSRYQMYVG